MKKQVTCDKCGYESIQDDVIHLWKIGPYVLNLHRDCVDVVKQNIADSLKFINKDIIIAQRL